jgi:type IV secretory pathway TrbL component
LRDSSNDCSSGHRQLKFQPEAVKLFARLTFSPLNFQLSTFGLSFLPFIRNLVGGKSMAIVQGAQLFSVAQSLKACLGQWCAKAIAHSSNTQGCI